MSVRDPGFRLRAAAARVSPRDPLREASTYQPALDGIRAFAVVAVLLYHGGVSFLGAGFLGVDVFFVLSGFLITSLLYGEWLRSGSITLPRFYLRRARRLLPALFTLLIAVVAFMAIVHPNELARLRLDVLGALTYLTNWFLIAQQQSYFEALGRPSLLQHLWSLAIEEQYYIAWPLALGALAVLTRGRPDRLIAIVLGLALASTVEMWWLYDPFSDPSRLYFGTDTRAAGLLIGSALAIAVAPGGPAIANDRAVTPWVVDVATISSVAILVAAMVGLGAYSDLLYQGGLTGIALATALLIASVRHPASRIGRAVFGLPVMRWLGLRSYAIYLWHWPIFMVTRPELDVAIDGIPLLVARFALTLILADLSFRFIEDPIRHGALGRWYGTFQLAVGARRRVLRRNGLAAVVALALVMVALSGALIAAGPAPEVAGLPDGVIGAAGDSAEPTDTAGPTDTAEPSDAAEPSGSAPVPWAKPVKLLLVGDSQANMLYLNRPARVDRTFAITNGWVEGCGVLLGHMTSDIGFRRNLDADCGDWERRWRSAATKAKPDMALIVLGAWDVFDLTVDGQKLSFGSSGWDAYFTSQLQRGIDILTGAGAQVAILDVPCYRPIESGGRRALPERRDDDRTRHLNVLFRQVAAQDPSHVFAIEDPPAFCTDDAIANDVYYRWDGVHYGGLGAKLMFNTITKPLLAIPRP